ncbi:MAG TPA: tetratricopeptide repeat protein, partial [Acidobacteriota bacterium]|nr:tetratricopeptide repeat protein [Acidobacteriota bacterium]
YLYRGQYAMDHGGDPTAEFEKAADSYGKAMRIFPSYSPAHSNLGLVFWNLGLYAMNTGKDPRRSMEKAIENFQNAVRLNPKNAYGYNSMGTAYGTLGSYAIQNGKDPTQLLEKSISSFEKVISIKPDWPYPYNNMGLGYMDKAKYAILAGQNPSAHLLQAEERFQRALKMNPEYADAHINLGAAYVLAAQNYLDQEESPLEALRRARDALGNATRLVPDFFPALLQQAEAALIEIESRMRVNKLPDAVLDTTFRLLQKASASNPQDAQVHRATADFYRLLSIRKRSQGKDIEHEIGEGLTAVEKALAIHPTLAEAHALRGIFCLLQVDSTRDSSRKSEALAHAKEAFRRALQINLLLQRKYHSELQRLGIKDTPHL